LESEGTKTSKIHKQTCCQNSPVPKEAICLWIISQEICLWIVKTSKWLINIKIISQEIKNVVNLTWIIMCPLSIMLIAKTVFEFVEHSWFSSQFVYCCELLPILITGKKTKLWNYKIKRHLCDLILVHLSLSLLILHLLLCKVVCSMTKTIVLRPTNTATHMKIS
jgi:hypothetical protein